MTEVENHVNSAQTGMASAAGAGGGADERDVYFVDAGRFIIEKDKASIGMLQRVFKIGFNRAARIMDQLYRSWCRWRGGRNQTAKGTDVYGTV